MNALMVALVLAFIAFVIARWLFERPAWRMRERIHDRPEALICLLALVR